MNPPTALPTLEEWSIRHIRDVFEAPTDADALRAISNTFSAFQLQGSANGSPIDFASVKRMVLALRQQAQEPAGLSVEWISATGFPDDASNRSGVLVGEYVVRGIWRNMGGGRLVQFERRKKVHVRIESQSSQMNVDSRRIVKLDFVGVDVPAE
ncbi:hypothetical protein HMN09_00402100 [Mycena chlorophos]|uniref:Uncharacterized protein n=1 Tax=Mycena chlorophos TaxID=658473 RepID=A0A8H6TJ59_MYCCL|nr:hypothetical protein HMN09_00402100 [Mycena chlorophos]